MLKKIINFIKKYRILVFLGFLLLIYIFSQLFLKTEPMIKLNQAELEQAFNQITSQPANNQIGVNLDENVVIYLPEIINIEDINITISPQIDLKPDWQDNQVTLTHQRLFNSNDTYTLEIKYLPTSQVAYQFSFQTLQMQGNPAVVQEIDAQQAIDYPLLQKLPYWENRFQVEYIGPLHLEIIYDGSPENKQAAENWLANYKQELANHQIDWKISNDN